MWNLLFTGTGLGLIDCLNPFTISTQIVLQPFVRKIHHILYYIIGTYLSYLVGGLCIYWGIDKLLADIWRQFMTAHSMLVYSLETALGVVLVIVAIVMLIRRRRKTSSESLKETKPPRSVHPVFLFFFGAANTIGDLPTAFPYLIFIAKMVDVHPSLVLVVVLHAFYCFIYILPLLLTYFLYLWNKGRLEALVDKLRNKVAVLASWAAIVFAGGLGLFFIIHGYLHLDI